MVLTKEEQECKPVLSSPTSKSFETTPHSHMAVKAHSALLLKENLPKMHKQPRDAVMQHLMKVCWLALLTVVFFCCFLNL